MTDEFTSRDGSPAYRIRNLKMSTVRELELKVAKLEGQLREKEKLHRENQENEKNRLEELKELVRENEKNRLELEHYKEVANAVYGRTVLEDLKKTNLVSYIIGDHNAANIEAACKAFLNDPQNVAIKKYVPSKTTKEHTSLLPLVLREVHRHYSPRW